MPEHIVHTAEGGILYEPSLCSKPMHELFEFRYWLEQQLATETVGGRGQVLFIRDHDRHWVLRHYRRGGLIAKFVVDRYVWRGAAATRSFREFRLLQQLVKYELPVPIPIAARYVQAGGSYRADLITQEISGACSLAACLRDAPLTIAQWQEVGHVLARFHALGVQHADLNAHNIVFDVDNAVYVLDFDRGCLCTPQRRWIDKVLARLLRSLNKLHAQDDIHFSQTDWQYLQAAHDEQLRRLRVKQT